MGERETVGMTAAPTPSNGQVGDLPFVCCGCGGPTVGRVKPCDCITNVGFRYLSDRMEHRVFINARQGRQLDLADLIKARLIGVAPDDQDLTLEDHDWQLIVAALEHGLRAPSRATDDGADHG